MLARRREGLDVTQNPHVFVIDDDPYIRTLAANVLLGSNFTAHQFSTAPQVEAALTQNEPAMAAERQAWVQQGTWDHRAAELAALIHSLLRGQTYAYQPAALQPTMEG